MSKKISKPKITHHAAIETINGTVWINLTLEGVNRLIDQIRAGKLWIDIDQRFYSWSNVISIDIVEGAWKLPERG